MMAGDLCDTRTDMRIATSFLMARSQSRLTLEQSLPVTEIAALHIYCTVMARRVIVN